LVAAPVSSMKTSFLVKLLLERSLPMVPRARHIRAPLLRGVHGFF
jgi:hypothetical protein